MFTTMLQLFILALYKFFKILTCFLYFLFVMFFGEVITIFLFIVFIVTGYDYFIAHLPLILLICVGAFVIAKLLDKFTKYLAEKIESSL